MNKLILKALVLLAAASSLTACTTRRFVTSVYWHNPDLMYVAYSEHTTKLGLFSTFTANVQMCHRSADDNALSCSQQNQLNEKLNAENDWK